MINWMSMFLRNGLMSVTLIQFCSGGKDICWAQVYVNVSRLPTITSHSKNFVVFLSINSTWTPGCVSHSWELLVWALSVQMIVCSCSVFTGWLEHEIQEGGNAWGWKHSNENVPHGQAGGSQGQHDALSGFFAWKNPILQLYMTLIQKGFFTMALIQFSHSFLSSIIIRSLLRLSGNKPPN